ncbi:MAG: hypothetical protein U0165_13195 [Polyangiaceae bacterium]
MCLSEGASAASESGSVHAALPSIIRAGARWAAQGVTLSSSTASGMLIADRDGSGRARSLRRSTWALVPRSV